MDPEYLMNPLPTTSCCSCMRRDRMMTAVYDEAATMKYEHSFAKLSNELSIVWLHTIQSQMKQVELTLISLAVETVLWKNGFQTTVTTSENRRSVPQMNLKIDMDVGC